MKKNNVIKNYLYNLSYQLLVIFIPLITTPYLSRVLGAKQIGIYSFTLSISSYFILFGSLGITTYAQREIAYVQENSSKRSKLFFEIVLFRAITMLISMIIFYFSMIKNTEYGLYYKILSLELFANIIDISWFFQGMEEFKKTVGRNLIVRLISVVCIFIFVKQENDLINYFYIYVSSLIIGNLSLWFYLKKYINFYEIKNIQLVKHIKPTIKFFIPQISIQIYTILDRTMIGLISKDMKEVGYYEQAQKIIKMLMVLVSSIGTVMLPRIANLFAKGEKSKIKEYMYKTFIFVFAFSLPLIFGVISIANNFVPIFFGNGYDKVIIVMSTLSPIIMFIGLSNVIGNQYLLTTDKVKEYTISVTVGAVVNFILNLILITLFKSIGAAIATSIAEFSVTFTQMLFIRKKLDINKAILYSKKYFLSSIIMMFVCLLVDLLIKNNLISLFTQVFIGVITYFSLLLLFKDEFILDVLKKVRKKVNK